MCVSNASGEAHIVTDAAEHDVRGAGLFNAMITVIAQLIAPCGYTSTDAGTISGVIIGCGLFGAAVAGPLMEVTKMYRPILKVGVLVASGGVTVFLLALRPDNTTTLLVLAGVMGFCMVPLLPVSLENNAEYVQYRASVVVVQPHSHTRAHGRHPTDRLTYPIPEETGSGLLLLNGQIIGVIFIIIFDRLIPMGHCTTVANPASILIWAAIGTCVLSLITYGGEYKRLKQEVSGSEKGADAEDVALVA